MAFSRAILFAALLSAVQGGVWAASILPSLDDLRSTVENLQQSSEASLNATIANATAALDNVEATLKARLSSTKQQTQATVDNLVSDAEAKGISSAAGCGAKATLSLASTWAGAVESLVHCKVDYLDAFGIYEKKIARDFADMFAAIPSGVGDATSCSLLEATCYLQTFYNATKVEALKSVDVSLQLLNAGTAAVNLVATITKCDEEKTAQAILDMGAVVPQTVQCIKQA